jgi:hypothetical protein
VCCKGVWTRAGPFRAEVILTGKTTTGFTVTEEQPNPGGKEV